MTLSDVQKKFSLSTIVATTLVSFLVSGVGGALLQRYLARAKPVIVVTSAGFEGPADHIEVSDELLGTAQDDSWGGSLSKFEKYAALRSREAKTAEVEARLTKAISTVDKWLKDSERGAEQVSTAELLRHPLTNDTVFGSSINGYIKRTELPPPPLTNTTTFTNLFPVFRRDGIPELHTGMKGI